MRADRRAFSTGRPSNRIVHFARRRSVEGSRQQGEIRLGEFLSSPEQAHDDKEISIGKKRTPGVSTPRQNTGTGGSFLRERRGPQKRRSAHATILHSRCRPTADIDSASRLVYANRRTWQTITEPSETLSTTRGQSSILSLRDVTKKL